jgi:tetratricopeptide (TPR) repeat protein
MSTPTLAEFQYEIGARLSRGDLSGAAAAAAGCRASWPADPAGWLLGSVAALLADDKERALALIDERLRLDAHDVQCLLQKAECLLALGRRVDSLEAADRAAAAAQLDGAALDAVGEFLMHAGEHRRALEIYDRAVELRPDDPSTHGKRAVIHRFLGHFEHAAADHDQVLHTAPHDAEALKGVVELRRQTPERNYVDALHAALSQVPAASKEAATLHFGLAKSYEDLGDHAASWRHLYAGNTIERTRNDYKWQTDRALIERIIGGFPHEEPIAPDTGERPIFILGLPRTGTTLVERILGSHSAVHSAGELPALSEAIATVADRVARTPTRTWLEFAESLASVDGPSLAAEYLARSRARRGDRPRFSDKQPTNFLYCGLILRAFPAAPIVHLTRHPLAACYAIYKTRFGGTYPFAYDLGELAEFYIGYRRLMDHWHRVLPGRILDVAYEDVVKAQEPTTRRLLEHVGLPFEPACLDFHLNADSTGTASSVQVRQPLYDSSLDQWRHYATELAPVRMRLEDAGIKVD